MAIRWTSWLRPTAGLELRADRVRMHSGQRLADLPIDAPASGGPAPAVGALRRALDALPAATGPLAIDVSDRWLRTLVLPVGDVELDADETAAVIQHELQAAYGGDAQGWIPRWAAQADGSLLAVACPSALSEVQGGPAKGPASIRPLTLEALARWEGRLRDGWFVLCDGPMVSALRWQSASVRHWRAAPVVEATADAYLETFLRYVSQSGDDRHVAVVEGAPGHTAAWSALCEQLRRLGWSIEGACAP